MYEKTESLIKGPGGLLTEYSKKRVEETISTSPNDENCSIILSPSTEEKFDDKTIQHSEKSIEEVLICWKLMKNSTHFLYIQDTPRINFNITKKRIEEIQFPESSKSDIINFIDSSIKKSIKDLNSLFN